jgi:hypothetical protein
MFFFKKKNIVLDCFTKLPYAYDYAKVDHAIKYIPDWWSKTPKQVPDKEFGTIKNCIGVLDYYKRGIVIPSWFEMELTIHTLNNPGDTWYSWKGSNDDISTEGSHAPYQFEGFAQHDGKNVKIANPWGFKTKEEIYFTATQPTWNLRPLLNNVTILPAVVNYKIQHFTHINMFVINKEKDQTCIIPPLTPLMMLHPMTERNVIIKHHLLTEKEWDREFGLYNLFMKDDRRYQKKKKIHEFLDKQGTCPFSGK